MLTQIGLEKCSMTWKNFKITKKLWHILIEPSKLDRIMVEQFKGIYYGWIQLSENIHSQTTSQGLFIPMQKEYL